MVHLYIILFLYTCVHGTHKFHCGNIYTLISRTYKILEEHGPKSLYGVECSVWSEKAMAPHSSVLAWRIPGMAEPGGLPSMGSHRVGHD